MPPIVSNQRKRATYSCDRCKQRKRACKRYDELGNRLFDNTSPCEQCKKTGSECKTTIVRKKRTFYSVSENSLIQLKCLTKIVKAMFPESDPNKFEDIKNIAKVLYVNLPNDDTNTQFNDLNESFTPVSNFDVSSDQLPLTPSPKNNTANNPKISKIVNQIEVLKNIKNTISNDNSIQNNHNEENHEEQNKEIDNSKDQANESQRSNDSNEDNEQNKDESNDKAIGLRSLQIGLGGAERLFTVLLEVEKRHSHNEAPKLDDNNSLTSVTKQRNQSTFNPSFVINGNDIQKFLLLDGIPRKECEFYTDTFFTRIHDRYFLFKEDRFRDRLNKFFKILESKDEDISKTDFTNEEICVIYLVWILGRKCYMLIVKNKNISNDNIFCGDLVSDYVISDYLNAVNLCLSCCFFTNSLNTIRMLYLSSLYHSTIKNRNAASNLMANSCIKCVSLGYHRSFPVSRLPIEEQEDVKIVWWSCFKLHINNCIIMGRLPNISLYEVDLEIPDLDYIKDDLFKCAYKSGIKLFKIMFNILKNREYLIKSKNSWCEQNFIDVLKIKNELLNWTENIDPEIKNFRIPNVKRYIIKLHMQYYHCVISLTVPYLIAYSLRPLNSMKSNEEVIKTLCLGIKSSIDIVEVIRVSSEISDFNGLLYYDLFYAYNSLMVLLLTYTLIKNGSTNKNSKNYNVLAHVLNNQYNIDIPTMMETIHHIKNINNKFGSTATSIMKDASNNINLLLKYFKIDNPEPDINSGSATLINNQQSQVNSSLQLDQHLPISPNNEFYMTHRNQDSLPNTPFENFVNADNEFFEIIQSINTEIQPKPLGLNDKFFWDWSHLFSMDE